MTMPYQEHGEAMRNMLFEIDVTQEDIDKGLRGDSVAPSDLAFGCAVALAARRAYARPISVGIGMMVLTKADNQLEVEDSIRLDDSVRRWIKAFDTMEAVSPVTILVSPYNHLAWLKGEPRYGDAERAAGK